MERYVDRLARALSSIINVFDPEVIVLGGGLSQVRRLYRDVPERWKDYLFCADASSTGGHSQVETRLCRRASATRAACAARRGCGRRSGRRAPPTRTGDTANVGAELAQYCSLNDSHGLGEIHRRGGRWKRVADGILAELALDGARGTVAAAGDDALLQKLLENARVKGGAVSGGNGACSRQLAADDPNGMKEGQAVGILTGLGGSFVHQAADGEVGHHQPVELLADEDRGFLPTQHDAGAAQMGLELVERAFDLPALVVKRGQFRGRSARHPPGVRGSAPAPVFFYFFSRVRATVVFSPKAG